MCFDFDQPQHVLQIDPAIQSGAFFIGTLSSDERIGTFCRFG